VDDTFQPETFGNLYKKRPVIDIHDFVYSDLCHVYSYAKNISIRFSEVDKTGRDKKISKGVKVEFLQNRPICISVFFYDAPPDSQFDRSLRSAPQRERRMGGRFSGIHAQDAV